MAVLTEEQTMLRDAAKSWAQEASPVSELRKLRDAHEGNSFDPAKWAQMGQMGWAGVIIPEEFGGSAFGYQSLALILEETGRTLRLFIDQNTRLPLMVQYQDPKPRIMMNGGPGPGRGPGGPGGRAPGDGPPPISPEEMQKRLAEMQRTPPEMGTYAIHLGDYKKVDGVMLPHTIETSLDGEPNEEWTIEKYKVNPTIKPESWHKK